MTTAKELEDLLTEKQYILDWRSSYNETILLKGERLKDNLIKTFAESYHLTEDQVRQIAYMSRRPTSSEEIRFWLSEFLVNCVYTLSEQPWERDYDDARKIAKLILGYCEKGRFRYSCPCDLEIITDSKHFQRLLLTQEDIDRAVVYARAWMGNR